MTLLRLMFGACCSLAAADAAAAESFLQKLNRGLQNVNQALAGAQSTSRAPSSTAPGLPALPQPTDQQIKQLTAAMQTPGKAAVVLPMYEDAKHVVGEVLLLSSCYPDYGISRYLMRYAAPNAFSQSFSAPMAGMTYHPKSECLTVHRLDDWKASAKNAFSFRAVYLSDDSGETRALQYEFVKQPDGVWLLRQAGF